MLSVPRLLSAGPELVGQFKGRNIQDPVLGIILIILSLHWAGCGPTAVCWFLASTVTDLLPAEEWAVPTPWKSRVFSWPEMGARLTEGPLPGAQAGA